ncbi:hypothetical protein LCGC14_1915020 [marine sediment metagenome]|uniref:Uncharacterized protein n=1 Tax=marine sediment metagenome TaxID=412755 RepID=A0A0F9FSD1_9ZZZZ
MKITELEIFRDCHVSYKTGDKMEIETRDVTVEDLELYFTNDFRFPRTWDINQALKDAGWGLRRKG